MNPSDPDADPEGLERQLRAVRAALAFRSDERLTPDQLAEGLGTLAKLVVAMGHRDLADICARVSVDVQDPDALYELGYQLIESGLHEIAASVLRQCLDVVPGSEQVLAELVAALERMLRYHDARVLLAAHPRLVEESFLIRYLYAYDAAMSGELATTRALAPGLRPADDAQRFMAARITQILERATRVDGVAPLDLYDLRGWHYVLTGGVVLHRSPYGFEDAMRGRYAFLQDSRAMVRTGLDRMRAALAVWGVTPPCVYAPPGRDHDIVAEAAARLLGVPRVPWPAVGVPAPGLVVAYDLALVEWRDLERLVERRADQLVFAHASLWTDDGPVAPDLTTLLHQTVITPWKVDTRDVDAIAADLVDADPLREEDVEHDDLPGLAALVAVAAPPVGRRERLWAGSPVPSNRFL